ncbi:hypothetical protein GOFOIKOB_5998 [Methylobacterium tardum]|jgi:hypothetical protein|uniref:Uncharacterized protein n=1 Tax=Methylobacterium tardum TaxID=374432 RepID=A0AA37THA7_9HYPH|nr:hypothetical protein GOFOIKOB_5998 [Methylobacterium tardum]GLS73881.1 hypothetical protein GCM10007890_58960 [Methylobacterium tardum]
MKPVYPLEEDRPGAAIPPATARHPAHEDELRQQQMRRQHNTRARERAARHHRAGRSLL